jgi:hypothetical protein
VARPWSHPGGKRQEVTGSKPVSPTAICAGQTACGRSTPRRPKTITFSARVVPRSGDHAAGKPAGRQLPVAVGDGTTTLTPSPRIGQVYARAGRYRVMLTVTHLAGTSTSTVFTGHTMLTTADPAPDTRTPCRFTRSFRRPRRSSRGYRESVPAAIARALKTPLGWTWVLHPTAPCPSPRCVIPPS